MSPAIVDGGPGAASGRSGVYGTDAQVWVLSLRVLLRWWPASFAL